MSVGSEIIGSDHRALIELINRVGDIAAGKGSAEIGNVLYGPIAYIEFHDAPEERMMVVFGYTGAERHVAEHVSFTDHIYQLRGSFDLDSIAVDAGTLSRYLQNWLRHHIMIQDMG